MWFIDPDERKVRVFRSPDDATPLTAKDTLVCGDVLPGFAVPVAELFAGLPAVNKPKGEEWEVSGGRNSLSWWLGYSKRCQTPNRGTDMMHDKYQFFGGPYDGQVVSWMSLNRDTTLLPIPGDFGLREFAIVPAKRLPETKEDETGPVHIYERVNRSDGVGFELRGRLTLDEAWRQARLKIDPRAKSALFALLVIQFTGLLNRVHIGLKI